MLFYRVMFLLCTVVNNNSWAVFGKKKKKNNSCAWVSDSVCLYDYLRLSRNTKLKIFFFLATWRCPCAIRFVSFYASFFIFYFLFFLLSIYNYYWVRLSSYLEPLSFLSFLSSVTWQMTHPKIKNHPCQLW